MHDAWQPSTGCVTRLHLGDDLAEAEGAAADGTRLACQAVGNLGHSVTCSNTDNQYGGNTDNQYGFDAAHGA